MKNIKKNLQGMKPYIPGKTVAGAIKLASNENALGTSPKARKAVADIINDLHLYPDGYCYAIKERLASKLSLKNENIIFGNGSDELLLLIAGVFVDKGDEIITSEATFSEYTFSGKVFAGEMKYVPLKDYAFDLDVIAKAVTEKTKLIYLCNPNNPTGRIFGSLDSFLEKIPEDIVVVSDEAYYEYVQDENYPQSVPLISKYRNLIVLRTFSKIYGLASLRIGYGLASEELIASVRLVKQPFNVNSVAQVAALAALDDEDFVAASIKNNELGKKYLYSQLKDLDIAYLETQANFIFIYDLAKPAQEVFKRLIEKGVVVRPMDSFGFDKAIRVTIGTPVENEKFIASLKEVLSNG